MYHLYINTYICINAYLYINIWMCPHPQKWAVDLDGLLGNVNFSQKKHIFPSHLTEEQESEPWKRCWKGAEWLLLVRETAGLWHTYVVSLLVTGKAGHLDFETVAWWHIPDDRPSYGSAHFCADHLTKWYKISSSKTVLLCCLIVQLYRSSGLLKLCCSQEKF